MITWVDLLVVEEGSVGEVFSPGDDEVSVEEVWSHLHNAALVSTGSQHPVDGLGGLHHCTMVIGHYAHYGHCSLTKID